MRQFWCTLVLAVLIALTLPLAAGALGLDVEANAGAGIGIGSTNNPSETGAPRFAFQGGIEGDLFLFSLGPVDLGLSTGLEYSNLTVHSTVTGGGVTVLDGDYTFVYLNVPFAIAARVPLSQDVILSLRAGGVLGHFLGGQGNNITNIFLPGVTSQTLDSSTTIVGAWGLQFSAGADIRLSGNLFLSPSVVFNMGLTNTTAVSGYQYSDTLGTLTAMIGLKYNVF